MKRLLTLALCLAASSSLLAEISLPHFFSDHMVLQRERDAAIWGKADAGATVTVAFKGQSAAATADANGRWRTAIATGAADSAGAVLTVASGTEKVEIADVLVGEVWLASGQSNMYFTMDRVSEYEPLIADTNLPGLRMFNAPLVTAVENQDDIEGEWTAATPTTIPGYSAVAFFFARKLHLDLGIPVAVLKTAWGGKPVETFTSREALSTLPGTKALVDAQAAADASYDPAKAQAAYETRLDQWEAAMAGEKKPADQRGKLAKKPTPPKRPLDTEGQPGVLFASMIHPFVGYTMRGAIWYQGEGNAKAGAVPYDQTLPLMINDWRKRWNDDFSFYFVQLANFHEPSTEPGTPDLWALLQDRMRLVLDTTPKTGMAIINDVGDAKDIHPKDKMTPGERLARLALAYDYDRDVIASGPLYQSSVAKGNAMHITFSHVGDGLKSTTDSPLKRFEIAGADQVWHWADAKIDGKDSVVVSSAAVKNPVAVRYAWAANPEGANLANSDDLPASVFRTDDWNDVEPVVDTSAADAANARRAMATKIKALAAQREKLDRNSDEFKVLHAKIQAMLKEYKATAPTK